MAFLPERLLTGNAASNHDHPLIAKIQKLSHTRWGKETILLGRHPVFITVLQKLEQFAFSQAPVLITGESGVGKELFAGALYLLSQRNEAAYVPMNCGQFNDEHLMVSELFVDIRKAVLPAPRRIARAFLKRPTAERSFWMKLANYPPARRKCFCVSSIRKKLCRWVRQKSGRSIFA